MKTLFVNLMGGPGVSKSTHSSLIFGHLKMAGVNSEYLQEYAKDRTWQADWQTLQCQPYVFGKQLMRQSRVDGKVEVAVTDACLLNSLLYNTGPSAQTFEPFCLQTFNSFRNYNILLKRNESIHPYKTEGRSQNLDEAMKLDFRTEKLLIDHDIKYTPVEVNNMESVKYIVKSVLAEICRS